MIADLLTKALPPAQFKNLARKLGTTATSSEVRGSVEPTSDDAALAAKGSSHMSPPGTAAKGAPGYK
jgi:hypothetical protein